MPNNAELHKVNKKKCVCVDLICIISAFKIKVKQKYLVNMQQQQQKQQHIKYMLKMLLYNPAWKLMTYAHSEKNYWTICWIIENKSFATQTHSLFSKLTKHMQHLCLQNIHSLVNINWTSRYTCVHLFKLFTTKQRDTNGFKYLGLSIRFVVLLKWLQRMIEKRYLCKKESLISMNDNFKIFMKTEWTLRKETSLKHWSNEMASNRFLRIFWCNSSPSSVQMTWTLCFKCASV